MGQRFVCICACVDCNYWCRTASKRGVYRRQMRAYAKLSVKATRMHMHAHIRGSYLVFGLEIGAVFQQFFDGFEVSFVGRQYQWGVIVLHPSGANVVN